MYDSISSHLIGLNLSDCLGVSKDSPVLSGVPQGTVLGPLLFIIISDINKDILSSKIISFADDTRIYTNITQIENSDSLQTDLNCIYLWAINNNILFLQKCIIYRYYYIKRLVVTSLEDITPKKIIFFMVAILNYKMASTDRDYSPFYNSVFSVMTEDRPSILFISCTVTSILRIQCNEIISTIIIKYKIKKRTKIYSLKHCFE